MASIYTLNVTATDIINALKAGKSILIHMTENDGTETFIAPTIVTFDTISNPNQFAMRVLIPEDGSSTSFHFITFYSSNLNSILTAEFDPIS